MSLLRNPSEHHRLLWWRWHCTVDVWAGRGAARGMAQRTFLGNHRWPSSSLHSPPEQSVSGKPYDISCPEESERKNGDEYDWAAVSDAEAERQPGREHVMDPVPQATSPGYKPANKLHGKVALVTGGDSGIGQAVCHCFALEGTTVAFTFVKSEEDKDAQGTLQMIKAAKSADAKGSIAVPADLWFEENCKMVVEEVVNVYGRTDVLVNNAAKQYNSIEEIDEQRLERVFRMNVFSYFFMCKYALNHMKEGSSIINTTSVVAYKGSPKLLDYTATKGTIVSFTRGLALHLINRGIRVNRVAPGQIWTPHIPASFNEEEVAKFGSGVPMKRAGQPFEVAPSYVLPRLQCRLLLYHRPSLHPNGVGEK
ncbi:NAD(P)-binding Rossmann-fold superfamily protein [Actinidia rufa]|uniref:NAD(P)-binding Rossmann-fold superfamily protein n=1 Tax=Actinidia rufa TaxID=165716 RepID=A0A7J0FW71_9ERIC|nr:NAD(P)-binding Rossmann-fold superfamily protein [Actinidia rufa]